jgi:hypothetical protein
VSTPASHVVVRPVRFTPDVAAMQAFLEILGLQPRISFDRPGWVDLAGSAGLVGLHDVSNSATGGLPGETRLSFEVGDADATAAALRDQGIAASVVDESFGRYVELTDPIGAPVIADEVQHDLYGYTRHEVDSSQPAPVVVPVRFTDEASSYDGFLRALGLTGTPEPGGYTTYVAPGGGEVGVHYVYSDDLPIVASSYASAHLTFAIDSGLDELQKALQDKGFHLERFDEDFGSFVDITDPDGQSVQVHQR